jgi:molybdopterin-containing oxidoreductase family membrane subunit
MTGSLFNTDQYRGRLDSVSSDILKNVRINKSFILWMGFLVTALAVCLYAYSIQLNKGLGVTGMRDVISWGIYIANFVFFVATSLVGMLISSVLGLSGTSWIKPITRIAEIIAVAFAAVAGLVIISDMGRPERLSYVFLFGRVQSPILWDVTVVTTYFFACLLLWFMPMIPDLEISKSRLQGRPAFLIKTYKFLSSGWVHHPKQYEILKRAMHILLVLIVPLAFAIHTVTSWLFAVTPRAGWDSSVFGSYFISGAFVSGTAAVIIAMYFYRVNYKLQKYLTEEHFEKMAKIFVLVCVVYIYFNINEFLVPGYKLKSPDLKHLKELFAGHYAPLFWGVQLGGLVIPVILMLFKTMRKPFPMMVIAVCVFIASWLKRFIIVIPPQDHPFLPVQNVPVHWMTYTPTLTEGAVTLGSIILVLIIITILSKLFPVLPIWELAEDETEKIIKQTENKLHS